MYRKCWFLLVRGIYELHGHLVQSEFSLSFFAYVIRSFAAVRRSLLVCCSRQRENDSFPRSPVLYFISGGIRCPPMHAII